MSNIEFNTEKRMADIRERKRRQLHEQQYGAAPSAAPRAAPTTPASSPATWIAYGGACVAGALLLRALLKGTAPSASSRYSQFQRDAAAASQGARSSSSAWHAPPHPHAQRSGSQQANHHSSTRGAAGGFAHASDNPFSGHSTHSSAHQSEGAHTQGCGAGSHGFSGDNAHAQREREKWEKLKSDYAKYEELLQASLEREAQGGDFFASSDRAFELRKDQARSDYVQSKWAQRKASKRILRYQSWAGGRMADDMEGEEFEPADAEVAAYRALQRQLATQPKYVQARQLLFATPQDPSHPLYDPASGASSPFISSNDAASFAPLTVASVRHAYFSRAKECHPDVCGREGSADRFRKLTEAYELLAQQLEVMEKRYPGVMESAAGATEATATH